ncbi:MAG: DUF3891 family protein [Acidobacteriota bacterium]
MIIIDEGPTLRFITQPDHARFSSQLLELWLADGLPRHRDREQLLFAVREHDNGWREADAAPRVDPESAKAHDFLSFPDAERLEVWKRGVDRYADSGSYATLLILEHARVLHSPTAPHWQTFLDELDERRVELLDQLNIGEPRLEADYRLLRLADKLSLAVCNKWQDPDQFSGYEFRSGDGFLSLRPFPLAGATTFSIPCRHIANRPFSGDADLGGELAAAAWQEASVRVQPL